MGCHRHTGYIEGFSKVENCKENVVESINIISLFCILKSVIKLKLFVVPFRILGKV